MTFMKKQVEREREWDYKNKLQIPPLLLHLNKHDLSL